MEVSFRKNVIILLSGGIIAQLIPIISNLLLARLYSPDNFGAYAAFFGLASILGSVSLLRYDITILLPKSNLEAKVLRIVSFIGLIIFLLLTITIFFVFNEYIIDFLKFPNKGEALIILLTLGVFCQGLNLINQSTLTRSKSFRRLTHGKIIYSVVMAVVSISLGYFRISNLGLILGNVVGLLSMFVYYQLSVDKDLSYKEINRSELLKLVKKYDEFPKFSLPATLLNGISNLGLPTIIAIFFSPTVAGIYFFTFKILKSPIDLILQSISQVFKAEANKLFHSNKEELILLIKKIQLRTFLVITPFLLFFSIFGHTAFRIVFGYEWEAAGSLIKFISFFILCNSIYNPISAVGDLLGEQKVILMFNSLLVVFQIGVFMCFRSTLTFNQNILIATTVNGFLFLILDQYMKLKLYRHV